VTIISINPKVNLSEVVKKALKYELFIFYSILLVFTFKITARVDNRVCDERFLLPYQKIRTLIYISDKSKLLLIVQ